MTTIISQALEMAGLKLEVERDHAVSRVVKYITDEDELIDDYVKSVDAGVRAAIEEIDDASLVAVNDAIREAASAEVEAQAKRLALRLMRDLAARSGQEMDVPF